MSTREQIIQLADQLIRDKGFNAFSFYHLSEKLKITNASIHYHFPTKTDLGLSVLENQRQSLRDLIAATALQTPQEKLNAFLNIYTHIRAEGRVCIVGSLATDLNAVDPKIGESLKTLAQEILTWVTAILEEGKVKKVFAFVGLARTRALLIITNMLAALQVARLTDENDFSLIKRALYKELQLNKS